MDAEQLDAYQPYGTGSGWGIRRATRWGGEDEVDLVHALSSGWHTTSASEASLLALHRMLTEYLNGSRVEPIGHHRRAAAQAAGILPSVPDDFPVRVLQPGDVAAVRAECGACGRAWDDAYVTQWTPAPAGRCPFEYFHMP